MSGNFGKSGLLKSSGGSGSNLLKEDDSLLRYAHWIADIRCASAASLVPQFDAEFDLARHVLAETLFSASYATTTQSWRAKSTLYLPCRQRG